jgi:hypothetical protein
VASVQAHFSRPQGGRGARVSNQKRAKSRHNVAVLRREMETIYYEVGYQEAAQLVGTTSRSWARWLAGKPITTIPRQFIRVLARLSKVVELTSLLGRGRPELTLEALRELSENDNSREW